jgi:hypothetical protein
MTNREPYIKVTKDDCVELRIPITDRKWIMRIDRLTPQELYEAVDVAIREAARKTVGR